MRIRDGDALWSSLSVLYRERHGKGMDEKQVIENFKASFACHKEILEARRKAGQKLEVTQPRYDDVFLGGVEVLDGK